MRPIEITHYVEGSYGGKPSYIILMSDGIEYISNGCVFQPTTEENLFKLTSKYRCGEYIYELLAADGIADEDLVWGSHMFRGCHNLTETGNYPSLSCGSHMYLECKLITEPAACPRLRNGDYMYSLCSALEEPGDYPKLESSCSMYARCLSLKRKGNYHNLLKNTCMYYR